MHRPCKVIRNEARARGFRSRSAGRRGWLGHVARQFPTSVGHARPREAPALGPNGALGSKYIQYILNKRADVLSRFVCAREPASRRTIRATNQTVASLSVTPIAREAVRHRIVSNITHSSTTLFGAGSAGIVHAVRFGAERSERKSER